ncbi:hypothetical protein BC835DRAFT_1503561 [Cytidiella melzeri]|nr:hypothetical protein BC835DRAFT_1503561 [Cytidiella melzeri]
MSADSLQELEIAAITLASLCGLFGKWVYVVLFILALWSISRHYATFSKRLRTVTVVLFIDLSIHFIVRSLEFARARRQDDSDHELLRWSIPLTVIGNVTTTFAGLLSDGTLVWRFYVVFNRQRWALYIPGTSVVINAFLCWSADAQHLAIYHHREFYENTLLPVTLDITVAWGWLMFTVNTLLTGGILLKILSQQRSTLHHISRLSSAGTSKSQTAYSLAVRAVIESALVTWVGLLIYEIASLAPEGHVTTNLDVGYVMLDIIPIFFGISQCLITARIGLSKEMMHESSREVSSDGQASGGQIRVQTTQEQDISPFSSAYKSSSARDGEEDGTELKVFDIRRV